MAAQILGEASLDTGERLIELRLDIGGMLDMEDYFGVGTLRIISDIVQKMRVQDLAVLYLAMTDRDWRSHDVVKATVPELMSIGLADVGTAVAECLTRLLVAGKADSSKKKK